MDKIVHRIIFWDRPRNSAVVFVKTCDSEDLKNIRWWIATAPIEGTDFTHLDFVMETGIEIADGALDIFLDKNIEYSYDNFLDSESL